MYLSTKQAVGHYLAMRKGPALRQQDDPDGVQRSYVDADEPLENGVVPDHSMVGRCLRGLELDDDSLAELVVWASTPDKKGATKSPPPPAARRLSRVLRGLQLIRRPIRPMAGRKVKFESIQTTEDLSDAEFRLLRILRGRAGEDGIIDTPRRRLQILLNSNQSNTARAITALCKLGFLERVGNPRAAHSLRILPLGVETVEHWVAAQAP